MDQDGSDLNNSNATEKLEAMQSELHCGICHDYFVQAFTLSCSHSFCFICINAWRANHTDCPVCRQETVGMAPSRALDNMVAALNGGANNANSSLSENAQRVDAWFTLPQDNGRQPQLNANQAEPETDNSYNGESDEGTVYDSETEELEEEDDGDYSNSDDEEEEYEDEEEGSEIEEEEEEEGDYEDESSYSDDEFYVDADYYEHVQRSNENNPNNNEYWRIRGWPERPHNWREILEGST